MSMLQLSPPVQLILRLFLRLFSPMLRAAIKEDMLVAVARNFHLLKRQRSYVLLFDVTVSFETVTRANRRENRNDDKIEEFHFVS